jgi:glycosyltransferase involved in cell wall biosynthesis
MQAGVPCICANFPEYQAIHQKYNCSVLIDCEVNKIAEAINKLLSSSKFYLELCDNCKTTSKYFNWTNEEQKLLSYYSNTV